jgi:hypothetical protein
MAMYCLDLVLKILGGKFQTLTGGKRGFPQVKKLDSGKRVPIATWLGAMLNQKPQLGSTYYPQGSGNYGPRTNIVTDANRYKGPTQIPRIGSKISNTSTYVPGKKFGM